MRYWWVNQNQTFDHEVRGGYLWSPKKRADGHTHHYYETMREVSPGDIIFSFRKTRIAAISVAISTCYESPKPEEFGEVGANWGNAGWKVDVNYVPLRNQVRVKDHIAILRPLLPQNYSPLRETGDGIQSVYLTGIPEDFAQVLAGIIGSEANFARLSKAETVVDKAESLPPRPTLEDWEDKLQEKVASDRKLSETEKRAIIQARRGQGVFRKRVQARERECRITKVDNLQYLVGSHIKPWRDCKTADERLDGDNGLLLTPSVDRLFDRGIISFEKNGTLIVSPIADQISLQRMGIETRQALNVGAFSSSQQRYLEFHRDEVFLKSRR